MTNVTKTKLHQVRLLFPKNQINCYIISTKDEYLSEYPPAYAKRLEYLTGFSGSNGLAVILENTVLFFTDGRYLTQCSKELDRDSFQIFDQKQLIDFPWENYTSPGDIIGYDPAIFTCNALLPLKKLNLKAVQGNLIDKIWEDRPSKPNSTIYNYDVSFAGEERTEKIAKCRNFLDTHGGEALVITNPEILCWLFNIRAADIEFSPLLLANGYITKENSYLFTDSTRIQGDLKGITIVPETAFIQIIQQQQGKILFDDNLCSKYISDIIKQKEHQNVVNPCLLWKSCKNSVEIDKMIEAHIQDGVAAVEFLSFLASNDLSKYSEYDLGLKLKDFRSKGYNYVTDSFPAIIGFKENGAIIHYRASQKSAKKMVGDGLLLIDSGGQYLGATTDITRVAVIGKPEQKYREYYTKILKGHLNLAMIKFPKESVTGANLDILARQFLWQDGDDYPHGTGHGVGSFLSVHEGPQNISLTSYGTKLAAGMVISNEPGFYQPGEFGIRIENMMYVKETTNSDFLEFGMLTLVPYEKNLIDKDLLSKDELNYLTCYYKLIEKKIMPHLSDEGKKWLHTQLQLVN
jgi:Xaa-Pro aminopeptidase